MRRPKKNKPPYFLVDAQQMNKKYPKRFWYASPEELDTLKIGDYVKVCIDNIERVWLKIVDMDFKKPVMKRNFTGTMGNQGLLVSPDFNDIIEFQAKHIYNYMTQEEVKSGKGWA